MKRNGFAQIPVMIGLLIMAVAVPVATKLVQQSQDTRNKAATNSTCGGENQMCCSSGTRCTAAGTTCKNLPGGSFCVKTSGPTSTPVPTRGPTAAPNVCTAKYDNLGCNYIGNGLNCANQMGQKVTSTNCSVSFKCVANSSCVPTPTADSCSATSGRPDGCRCSSDSQCLSYHHCLEGNYGSTCSSVAPTPAIVVGASCTNYGGGYKCLDNGTKSGLCSFESGEYRWVDIVHCDYGCNTGNGMCKAAPTATPVPLKNNCNSGDSCVSGTAGSCSGGTTYGFPGVCQYSVLGRGQDGICCTKTAPTPAYGDTCEGTKGGTCWDLDARKMGECTQWVPGNYVDCFQSGGGYYGCCKKVGSNPTATPKPMPCCCNPGGVYGNDCFWSEHVGECYKTGLSYTGRMANIQTDTSKCSGTNPNPTAIPTSNTRPPITATPTTGTCANNYATCGNGATRCCSGDFECKSTYGGYFCIPKPGTTGNPTQCTNGATKCQSEIANISYEYKCTNGSWVKDKRCDGACNGNVCASFTKCNEGETKCNNTTKVFEKCVKVRSAATGYTTNWQGTYCENGCNSSGCLSASPTGSHTNPSPTNKAGAGSGCDGAIPRDICDANKLSINAQCVNNSWDYDKQLCDQTGRKETCGGRPYCCPSAGGQWTTDMTACGGSGGACTQCAGHPDWKVKGDADCSGTTTINDFSVWKSEYISGNFGTETKNSWNADFNCDGKVTLNDGSIWTANFIKGLTN